MRERQEDFGANYENEKIITKKPNGLTTGEHTPRQSQSNT